MPPTTRQQSGAISLALVVAVSLVLTMIILSIQALTLLSVRLANSNLAQKATFYAAEGSLFDTLTHINNSYNGTAYDWPAAPLPLDDFPPAIGDIDLTRHIEESLVNPGEYLIDITASSPKAARKLSAKIKLPSGVTPLTDIVLILDTSDSMEQEKCSDFTDITQQQRGCKSIFPAEQAAAYFMQLVNNDPNIYTSLITFNSLARLRKQLNSDHQATVAHLRGLVASNSTNYQHALKLAEEQFNNNGQFNSRRFIIFLTDGITNVHGDAVPFLTDCGDGYPTLSDYQTSAIDTSCIDQAKSQATALKTASNPVTIFTIGLGLLTVHGDFTQGVIDLAHHILDHIASDPDPDHAIYLPDYLNWTASTDLQTVYQKIFIQIMNDPYLWIDEVPAG